MDAPAPPPGRPWVLLQTWESLAFLHWRVDPARIAARLPPGLAVDAFDGAAWVGVVPFRMTGVRLRCLPPIPGARAFPEVNVRTYVRAEGRAGVWFLSLDASSALAVAGARAWYRLPYHKARMRCDVEGDSVRFESRRTHAGSPPAELRVRYRATGAAAPARAGSLEHFLAERYCLFAAGPRGLLRADVRHAPWPLQPGEAEIERNTMSPLPLEGPPLVHVSRRLAVQTWAPVPVRSLPD